MDPLPQSFSRDDWDRYARSYDTLLKLAPYQELLATVLRHLNLERQDVFLDAGCGTGNLIRLIRDTYPTALRLYGIDLSESMLALAQTKCAKTPDTVFTRVNLSETLPFPDNMFTKIASVNVLYALPDPLETLAELRRVLTPRGRFVLVTPKKGYDNGLVLKAHARSDLPDSYWTNPHSSKEREAMLIRKAISDPHMIEAMLHVAECNRSIARTTSFHFFTLQELMDLVNRAGLEIGRVSSVYADQAWLVTLKKGGGS